MKKTDTPLTQNIFNRMCYAFITCLNLALFAAVGTSVDLAWAGSVLPSDQANQSWLMSNNAASFTYTGSQTGFSNGTVYTLSTAGNSLGFCTLLPNTQTTPLQYTTSCFTGYGTILGSGQSYSAVAFLGTQNNPTASFIVGDSAGNISIATPSFQPDNTQSNPSYVVTGLIITPLPGCPSGAAVANLALDPSGNYVYIGCYSAIPSPILVQDPGNVDTYWLPGYTLYSAPVLSNGTNVTVGNYVLQSSPGGIFSAPGNSQQAQNQIAAVWPGVSPVMRAYPAGYPGLQTTTYASKGGILVSGLISSVTCGGCATSTGPLAIGNSTVMCSAGSCGLLPVVGNQFKTAQIITALEIGMDSYSGSFEPAVYTSSLSLNYKQVWSGSPPPGSGLLTGYFATIAWQDVSPTINSCPILTGYSIFIGPYIGCGTLGQNLSWPPNGMPTPGNGYQIDITNLTYIPVPANNVSPYTQGLLMIGTWTNGYLSYYSPANPNQSTGLFLNQENGGNIGNVNAITADKNGNILFQTGSQGLYAMNPFFGTNSATGTDTTLIQQPADISGTSLSASLGTLLDPVEFVYYSLQTIKFIAGAAAVPPESVIADSKRLEERSAEQIDLTPRFSLIGPFNLKNYRGQFVYTQSQLALLGLNPGDVVQGLRFRDEEGKIAAPARNLNLRGMKITLSKPAIASEIPELKPQFSKNSGSNRKTVKSGPMTLFQGGLPSTGVHADQGVGTGVYGQLIPFRSPYIYEGGNLLVDIASSGKTYKELVSVDAFGTRLNQGLYQTPKKKRPILLKSVPSLEFVK